MRFAISAAVAACAILVSAAAVRAEMTTTTFLEFIDKGAGGMGSMTAMSYLSGVLAGIDSANAQLGDANRVLLYCPGEDQVISGKTALGYLRAYVEDHAEAPHDELLVGDELLLALQDALPCPQT